MNGRLFKSPYVSYVLFRYLYLQALLRLGLDRNVIEMCSNIKVFIYYAMF